MSTAHAAATRLPSLTGLRFLAVLLVFLTHGTMLAAFADSSVQERYAFLAGNAGNLGATCLFVVSGFLLAWASRPGERAAGFWRRRLRALPAHVAVFALAFAVLAASGVPVRGVAALANLLLVHTWVPVQDFAMFPVSGDAWLLAAGLLFCLVFPLLMRAVRRVRPSRLRWWTAAAAIAAVAAPFAARLLLPDSPSSVLFNGGSWYQHWAVAFFPGARLLEFVVGMLLARLVHAGLMPRIGTTLAATLLVAGYALSLYLPPIHSFAAVYVVPVGLLVGALASADVAGRGTALGSRAAVALGGLAHPFLLVHVTVMFSFHAAFRQQWVGYFQYDRQAWATPAALAFLVASLALCLLAAWLLHVLVERPTARWWRSAAPAGPVTAARVAVPETVGAAR
ncbi:acyltransferase family protein [Streptomyces sp. Da 82-17]|uniref:acyltransferase family protein n=1 Tax=Streptomyces sp. Da 82-17 TaxID=3377116 RepID=UPI0038D4CA22